MKVRYTLELDLISNVDPSRDPWPCDVSQFIFNLEDAIHNATCQYLPDQLTVDSYNLTRLDDANKV